VYDARQQQETNSLTPEQVEDIMKQNTDQISKVFTGGENDASNQKLVSDFLLTLRNEIHFNTEEDPLLK